MRGLYVVAVCMAVLLTTAAVGNIAQRSLRAAGNDSIEERGIIDSARSKLQQVDAKLGKVQTKLKGTKAKLVAGKNKIKEDINVYKALQRGEDHDEILAGMGVKFTHIDEVGNKFYDPKDPGWQRFNKLFKLYNLDNGIH